MKSSSYHHHLQGVTPNLRGEPNTYEEIIDQFKLFDYSNCTAFNRSLNNNGHCDINYDTTECECVFLFPEDGFDYSNCSIPNNGIFLIGDKYCHNYLNITECNYDGGDCVQYPNDGFDYSNCDADQPELIGNGHCDYIRGSLGYWYLYNTPQCNHDGKDCLPPQNDGFNYSACDVELPHLLGNGECESMYFFPNYNTQECNFDGGDCEPPNIVDQIFLTIFRLVFWGLLYTIVICGYTMVLCVNIL